MLFEELKDRPSRVKLHGNTLMVKVDAGGVVLKVVDEDQALAERILVE
jgi:hypothetical protein